ncbi:helix-turn-helix domain-containing protein [Persicitalea sp.]|uniref:helix-turn-helix domain-containing protein n=1 Tax=Persicitalea sp. TaxID=3100273 RepID=UPI00359424CB
MDITTYREFDDYYRAGNGLVRSRHPDFHIFRFNELGPRLVDRMGPFKTNYYQFAIVNRLNARVSVFDKSLVSETCSLIVFVPGQIIEWTKTGDWDGYVVNVKADFLGPLLVDNSRSDSYGFLFDSQPLICEMDKSQYDRLAGLYELMLAEHKVMRAENIQVIKNLMQVLVVFLKRVIQDGKAEGGSDSLPDKYPFAQYVEVASRFKSLVVKGYQTAKSVQYYAEKLGVTSAFLNKSTRSHFGKSAKEIIQEVLMIHAKTMLKNSEVGVKEIAYQLNYTDYSHFVKFFKAQTGFSPAQYRESGI